MARPFLLPRLGSRRLRPVRIFPVTVVRNLAIAAAINLSCVARLKRLATLRTCMREIFLCLCPMSSLPLCHDLVVALSQALPITARLRTWLSRFKLLVTDNALFNQIIHPLWEAGRVTAPARLPTWLVITIRYSSRYFALGVSFARRRVLQPIVQQLTLEIIKVIVSRGKVVKCIFLCRQS